MQAATIDGVQLFVKALYTEMRQETYDALPDRQAVQGLPVDGVTYRDSAHPGLTFLCYAGDNWARYGYHTFQPVLR